MKISTQALRGALFVACAMLALGRADAVSTTLAQPTSAAWTDLGAGPLQVQTGSSACFFSVSDAAPNLSDPGFTLGQPYSGLTPFPFQTTSHVYAKGGSGNCLVVVSPISGYGTGSGGGSGGTANAASTSNATDGQATSTTNQQNVVYNYGYNGATWDRARSTNGAWNTFLSTPLPTGTNTIGAVNQGTSPWADNVSQIGGVAPTMGAGASAAGTQRVILSSDTQALVGDALAINQPTALLTGANQTGTITGTTAEAFVSNGKPTYTTGTVAPLNTNTSGSLRVDPTGYTGQGYLVPSAFFGITPVVATNTAALSAKTSSGALYGVSAYNATTTAGFLIEYNANATPANGATLTNTLILGCHPLPASGEKETQRGPFPKTFNAGIQILVSSTPCYGTTVTYTTGTVTAYIEAEVQ